SRASRRAMARPSPRDAPVTNAVCPFKLIAQPPAKPARTAAPRRTCGQACSDRGPLLLQTARAISDDRRASRGWRGEWAQGVHAQLLSAARHERRGKALVQIRLLIAIEPAGDAAPEDPPLDLALHLVRELQSGGVDTTRLLDAKIVAGKAESGTKAEAAEVEP